MLDSPTIKTMKPTLQQRVLSVIGEQVLQVTFTLSNDLKADEGTVLSLEESLDAEFDIDISDPEILACVTIQDVIDLVSKKVESK
jgi:acyl carrier protein